MPERKTPFTDAALKALQVPPGKRLEVPDPLTPGLRFRKTYRQAAAKKPPYGSFSVVYRIKGGGQDRLTLGDFPLHSVAEARELAADALKKAARGVDPKAEASKPEILTFEVLFNEWWDRYGKTLDSGRTSYRMVRHDALPALGHLPADDPKAIRRAALAMSDKVVARGAVVLARRLLAVVSSIYTWGVRRNMVDFNPIKGIQYPGKERPGRRVLSDDELRALLLALVDRLESRPNVREYHDGARHLAACAVLSRALLGQRTKETLAMARPDFDGADWWNLPAEITKTDVAHRVFLIPLWRDLVWPALDELSRGSALCYPAAQDPTRPIRPTTVTEFIGELHRPVEEGGVGFHFTARDLRRTYITILARLQVKPETRMRMVNHKIPGIHALHYDRYDYDAEKKAAALVYDAFLRKLLYGEEAAVLPFPGSKEA